MPADSPPPYSSSPPTQLASMKKSRSSPTLLRGPQQSFPYVLPPRLSVSVAPESDADDDEVLSTTFSATGTMRDSNGLRKRISGPWSSSSRDQERPKMISTARGALCAGETETEIDEPPKHLPTTRIIPSTGPLFPPSNLQQQLTPILFEISRLLSIVPSVFGTLYNIYHIFRPPNTLPDHHSPPERVDFVVSAIWSILTGYQCLCLATGLLTRWRLYYSPLSTLIRLLALQGICWPATQLTCAILEHKQRPVIVWAVIGTTTCVSRSLQIWVTSNLWWETRDGIGVVDDGGGGTPPEPGIDGDGNNIDGTKRKRRGYWRRWGGKWGGRRWNWKEVGMKCAFPAGVVYFIMAWAEQLRREFSSR